MNVSIGVAFYLVLFVSSLVGTSSKNLENLELLEKVNSLERLMELLLQHLDITITDQKVDCKEQCIRDDSCTSVFWSNTSDSECRFVRDRRTNITFRSGELYYCKDCETTIPLMTEGEDAGVIKLVNVASNQPTEASTVSNSHHNSSMAVDGNFNTQYSSEVLLNKEESWLMIDLGERHLVAQVRITVKNTFKSKQRGGFFKLCLVNHFDRNVNPCSTKSEILKVNQRLRSTTAAFDVKRIITGRYLVIKKIDNKEILEVAELHVYAVIPVVSYVCEKCKAQSNTECDALETIPKCKCTEKHFPINGDPMYGCKDPCSGVKQRNTICLALDSENYECQCQSGFFPIYDADICSGCIDSCVGFRAKLSECIPVGRDNFTCRCRTGVPMYFDDPCLGCADCPVCTLPNTACNASEENPTCKCIDQFFPINRDVRFGCSDPCWSFSVKNAVCVPIDFKSHNCSCKSEYFPIEGDPCNGCTECRHDYVFYSNFGCLKVNENNLNWEAARQECISEGTDLFIPGDSHPILPQALIVTKDTRHWIGVIREDDGPFRRVATRDQTVLPDDSPLWDSAAGDPERGSDDKCVMYIHSQSGKKYVYDYTCSSTYSFICQKAPIRV